MTNFKGVESEAARNSIPQGYYQDMTNVDNTNLNRARHRQGLSRVTKNTLDTQDLVTSGEVIPNVALLQTSGDRVAGSGSLNEFPHFVASGMSAAGSGETIVPVFFRTANNRINVQASGIGFYDEIDTGAGGSYRLCMAGMDQTENEHGSWDFDNYSQQATAVFVSGGIPQSAALTIGIGVSCFVQPENQAGYAFYMYPNKGSVSGGDYVNQLLWNFRMYSSGVEWSLGGGASSQNPPLQSGIMKLEVEKLSETQTWVSGEYAGEGLFGFVHDAANKALFGDPLSSGYPGISAGIWGAAAAVVQTPMPWDIVDPSGGSSLASQTGGLPGSSQPSGFASAMVAQQAHGKLHYHYVDASGNFIILEDPVVET